jgi:hypothetical protein
MAEGIDLSELIKQYATQGSAQAHELENLNRVETELGSSVDTEVDAIRKQGALTGQIQTAVDQILLNRAGRNQEAAAFFGVNQEASNSIVQAFAQDLIERDKELTASGNDIKARQQRSFGDDPLGWIYDQFALPEEIAAHNTALSEFERKAETLQKLGTLADAQIARNNAIDANTSAAISRMAADKALATAEINAQNARQKAMQMGIQLGSVRLATTQQAFSNMVAVHQAGVAVQHLQLSRQTLDLNREQKELQRKNLELMIEKKDEDAQARAELQANLDRATGILGLRRVTVAEYDHAPQKTKSALFDVMSDPNIAQGRLGYDTVDALETANNLNAPLTPSVTEMKKVLTKWTAQVATSDPTFNALKPDQKHVKTQEYIAGKVKIEANDIPEVGGIYSAPSLSSVGQIPVVTETILWKSTFAPIAAAQKNKPTSPQAFFDAAASLVLDGKMDIERASTEIATTFKAVAMDNTQNRDYNRFALPIQNNYRTSIAVHGGLVDRVKVIDMSNPTEVKNALMRNLAMEKASKSVPGLGIYN